MPTVRQIVGCLVAARPIRCRPRLLLSAKSPNCATNNPNQDTSMVVNSSGNNNNTNNNNNSSSNSNNIYHNNENEIARNRYLDRSYI
ncbi:putative uncharacterized protein DDB_G0283779 [Harpegnathos saltator]|uniref:putative uncharacterized protein DDB_G0283779 n=1 Tax=Harpegnathos saltator TaxID=610380 RepID=UPI0009490F8F|nr:putative uncharacterized protein DDB_G0283779 [Harpegnathos saltator]